MNHSPPPRLVSEPPAAKFVYKTLKRDGPMTKKEIHEETLLPRRTAHDALETLDCHDLVRVRESTQDGRQQIYEVE